MTDTQQGPEDQNHCAGCSKVIAQFELAWIYRTQDGRPVHQWCLGKVDQ